MPSTTSSTLAVVIAIAAVFGLSYSLSGPLIALQLEARGAGPGMVGANAAMHALGVLLVAPVLPWLSARGGRQRLVLGALAATAAIFVLFAALMHGALWTWFVLRLGLGIAAEMIFVLTESWASELSPSHARGRVMATYTAVLSIGFAAGPALLSFLEATPGRAFIAGAASAVLAAALLMGATRAGANARDHSPPRSLPHYMRLSPLAMGTTVLNAAVETAGLSFLALYATRLGWSKVDGTRLLSAMMIGAIVLQLPIGWLADRLDRRRLIVGLSLAASAGAFAWPVLLRTPPLAFALVFVWGGVFVGIYTCMLAEIGERYSDTTLIGIYGAMGLFWGVGALLGPLAVGLLSRSWQHGLPMFCAIACLVFAIAIGARRTTPPG
ncbi:MFS family permease [Endobacter medicaginis]|uniref:MFS family permease n=3 Tax=Endobacter medicaginis TaxID=1181271 RepID=A0A839URL9_9PROT|nr:MFS transporter [Endobacter medicaginis]MBB3172407.1 MFS family permease [Endobacter medicaginis]MCX5474103.1 MFS transporter [Endobacter medicaginis]